MARVDAREFVEVPGGEQGHYNRGVNAEQLSALLAGVANRSVTVEDAMARIRRLPFEDLAFATVDHHRAVRCGRPEVIFASGKTAEQAVEIARRLSAEGQCVLTTRASGEQVAAFRRAFDRLAVGERSGTILVNPPAEVAAEAPEPDGAEAGRGRYAPYVAVVSAGTADLPVVEEAMMTLRAARVPTRLIVDVGVSGLHRLLAHVGMLQGACAVIVVAGMEGALPSVVGGLVACPVFAVPTSVGYGASFGGLAAMLGMLNSCASSVCVVNIDNGFGAANVASLVHHQVTLARTAAL